MKPHDGGTLSMPCAALAELMAAVLEKGGHFSFRCRGSSMVPFIRDGDFLTIAPLETRPHRVGEVVAFLGPPEDKPALVIHRIVGIQGTSFVIQGDGNGCAGEIVRAENVMGNVVRIERNGGRVRLGLGSERRLIAWLSRTRLIWRFVWPALNRVREVVSQPTGVPWR